MTEVCIHCGLPHVAVLGLIILVGLIFGGMLQLALWVKDLYRLLLSLGETSKTTTRTICMLHGLPDPDEAKKR